MTTNLTGPPTALPFIVSQPDSYSVQDIGGMVSVEVAGASLNIGDYVFRNPASDRMEKSLESSPNMCFFGGVVVGGALTGQAATGDPGSIGKAASVAGQNVLVQYSGICYAALDSTTVIQVGHNIYPGQTTAGRIRGHASPASYAVTVPVTQQSAGTATLGEALNAFQTIIAGAPGTTTAAGLDTAALVGTVNNGLWGLFVFRVATNGTTVTTAATVGAATQSAIVWPTAGAANLATWGAVMVHPTGTGNFVGGTTSLSDGTVVPNAVYFDLATRKVRLGVAMSLSSAVAGSAVLIQLGV